MTVYSFSQLETLWINAGGSKALAPLMAAIALAESSGNDQAVNATDNGGTQTSWGLWQISNGTHSWPGSMNPLNAEDNARYAVQKYKDQGLDAWGTYTSGAYQRYYSGNVPPASSVPLSSTSPNAQTVAATQAQSISSIDLSSGAEGGLLAALDAGMPGLGEIIGFVSGVTGNPIADMIGQIAKAFATLTAFLGDFFHGIAWLLNPGHWLRIISAIVGALALGFGIYLLATAN